MVLGSSPVAELLIYRDVDEDSLTYSCKNLLQIYAENLPKSNCWGVLSQIQYILFPLHHCLRCLVFFYLTAKEHYRLSSWIILCYKVNIFVVIKMFLLWPRCLGDVLKASPEDKDERQLQDIFETSWSWQILLGLLLLNSTSTAMSGMFSQTNLFFVLLAEI